MKERVVEKIGDVKIYGKGSVGGKGAGLVKINEHAIPRAHKLTTRVLTTSFYDRFLENDKTFPAEDLKTFAAVLDELGRIPISVRSSATNEAGFSSGKPGPVHAGENRSFMLPNNHPDPKVRFDQLRSAIYYIYEDFLQKQPSDGREKMAIVMNPIPGIFKNTLAGPFYYPYISGVANSFFPHALKTQDPSEGFARIAFGHGYATVLDDFPVISMATVKNPIPLDLLEKGKGQQYFYALDMTKNTGLTGEELETMKKLHIRFAGQSHLQLLGIRNNRITIEELVQKDHFRFRTDLVKIMENISAKIFPYFQIEFVFNIDFRTKNAPHGKFHVVQLTRLPDLKFTSIQMPKRVSHTYLSIQSLQGHGIKKDVKFAVVVSPFTYTKEQHDAVRDKIAEVNQKMRDEDENYMIVVPGRLGSKNKDWGISIDYKDIDRAVAIFEYGVDIAGRPEPLPEEDHLTSGVYGSHFLYMILGGYDEEQKRMQTRMYGTQGSHFLTNLMGNNIIYGYIAPTQDVIDPWFFSDPDINESVSVLTFPRPVTIYADSVAQRCKVIVK